MLPRKLNHKGDQRDKRKVLKDLFCKMRKVKRPYLLFYFALGNTSWPNLNESDWKQGPRHNRDVLRTEICVFPPFRDELFHYQGSPHSLELQEPLFPGQED